MDVFDLVAKIRLDDSEYEQGIGKAKGSMSKLASGVGKGLATVAKVGAAAVSVGVAGVAALTKMGVEGYKEYEQLAGGAKLLWGEAYNFVAEKAAGAYATVQMSQNDYLQQVNGFSVGLKTALGGNAQAAAELADKIVTAEADIVAATGATQENVQNAFNGIMKNNFSMVDNLGLGITATKEGFQTMIDSVNAYNAAHGNATKYTIDNVADCQAALVDYVAMQGMAGYAGMEAAKSLEGSIAMMKSAWQNLVVGMADENANMDVLINNFVESTAIAAQNLIPRIEQTLIGIGALIEKLAPIIGEALPRLIEAVLPSLISAGVSLITALITGIAKAAPALYQAFLDAIHIVLTDVFGMSEESASTFVSNLDSIIRDLVAFFQAGIQAIANLFNWLTTQAQTEGTTFNLVWENIKTAVSGAIQFIQSIIQMFTAVLQGDWSAAWTAVESIAMGAANAIGGIIAGILNLLFGVLGQMVSAGFELINSLAEGIQNKFAEIMTLVGGWVTDNIINPIANMGTSLYNAGVNLLNNFWNGLKSVWDSIANWWNGLKLSDKSANVNVNKNGGGYATGLNYVPYDEFPAILHRGEAVLTAAEARVWRNGGYGATPAVAGGITINQYIQSVPQTPADFANATEAYFEQARWIL